MNRLVGMGLNGSFNTLVDCFLLKCLYQYTPFANSVSICRLYVVQSNYLCIFFVGISLLDLPCNACTLNVLKNSTLQTMPRNTNSFHFKGSRRLYLLIPDNTVQTK